MCSKTITNPLYYLPNGPIALTGENKLKEPANADTNLNLLYCVIGERSTSGLLTNPHGSTNKRCCTL